MPGLAGRARAACRAIRRAAQIAAIVRYPAIVLVQGMIGLVKLTAVTADRAFILVQLAQVTLELCGVAGCQVVADRLTVVVDRALGASEVLTIIADGLPLAAVFVPGVIEPLFVVPLFVVVRVMMFAVMARAVMLSAGMMPATAAGVVSAASANVAAAATSTPAATAAPMRRGPG